MRPVRCSTAPRRQAPGHLTAGALLGAGALLTTGALDGAIDDGAVEAELDAAEADESGLEACELELLLHPVNATETDTAMTAGDQIQERENRGIGQQSATAAQNLVKQRAGRR